MKKFLIALMMGVGVIGSAVAQVESGGRVSNFYTYDVNGSREFIQVSGPHEACKLREDTSIHGMGAYAGQYTMYYVHSNDPSQRYFQLVCEIVNMEGFAYIPTLSCIPPGYVIEDLTDGCYPKP